MNLSTFLQGQRVTCVFRERLGGACPAVREGWMQLAIQRLISETTESIWSLSSFVDGKSARQGHDCHVKKLCPKGASDSSQKIRDR